MANPMGNRATGRGTRKGDRNKSYHVRVGGNFMKTERAYKNARGKIKNALIKQLKEKQIYYEPYCDLVEQYLNLWDHSQSLDDDIKDRGVSYMTDKGYKKNDSVALLVNVVKQMTIILDKLSLQATPVKNEGGSDV